jgi:uncharacterized membrane protein
MPVGVLGLLLAAALLHAGWNILLKTSDDPLRTAGRGMVVGAAVLIPAAFVGWLAVGRPAIPTEAWALAILSGVLEAGYFVLLSAAYRRGDLSLVYPIARGTAPVLAVGGGVVFLGERLGPLGTLGVALLLAGILALQRPWAVFRRGGTMPRNVREAAWLAVATGVTIAGYSGVDRVGARLIAPWLYAALIWTFGATFLVGWIALVDRRGRRAAGRAVGSPGWTRPAIGGLVTVGAYLLVLVAYVYAPLSAVAPVRESAIVLVSGWGAFRLGEATDRRRAATRVGAAVVIVVGAFLLALEH